MKKEEASALIMAAAFLILPDVGLTKAQEICMLIALYGAAWSTLTWIELRIESHEKKLKRALTIRKMRMKRRLREQEEEYAV